MVFYSLLSYLFLDFSIKFVIFYFISNFIELFCVWSEFYLAICHTIPSNNSYVFKYM